MEKMLIVERWLSTWYMKNKRKSKKKAQERKPSQWERVLSKLRWRIKRKKDSWLWKEWGKGKKKRRNFLIMNLRFLKTSFIFPPWKTRKVLFKIKELWVQNDLSTKAWMSITKEEFKSSAVLHVLMNMGKKSQWIYFFIILIVILKEKRKKGRILVTEINMISQGYTSKHRELDATKFLQFGININDFKNMV